MVQSLHSKNTVLNKVAMKLNDISKRLALASAFLMMLGLFTGVYISMAMTNIIDANVRMVVASHLNALLGGFWMLGVGWSLQWWGLDLKKASLMAWCLIVANYANWFITAVKALFDVHGVDFIGSNPNDIIVVLLGIFVVVPSFTGCGLWCWGLCKHT